MFQQVSERALVTRINRVLAKDHQRLCKCRRDSRAHWNLGDFYVIDVYSAFVKDYGISDLNSVADDLGIRARLAS